MRVPQPSIPSPFDLQQQSEFSAPVSPGHERELAEATRELAEATSELKMPSYDPILPSRIADRIVNAARGNAFATPSSRENAAKY